MISVAMDEVGIKSAVPSPADPVPDEYDLLCEYCGYSLVGLIDSKRCPECGQEFDPKQLPLARAPWLYRKRLGWASAYFHTVRLILKNPKAFATELCRPVRISIDDARKFRQLTIHIVMMTAAFILLLAAYSMYIQMTSFGATFSNQPRMVITLIIIPLLTLSCLRIFLGLSTDMPTFIWKGLPTNPADLAPLHCYACAPLALAPLIVGIAAVGMFVAWITASPALFHKFSDYRLVAMVGGFPILVMLWYIPLIFMRTATNCSVKRMAMLVVYLPFHWLIMAAMNAFLWLNCVMLIGWLFEPMGAM